MIDSAIFWAFALVSVGAALGAILSRSIIYAAMCLIAVFLGIAGFFLLNNADFLAIAQIIIYAVGLTIIMLFAIMFTGDKPMRENHVNRISRVAYGLVALYVLALLGRAAFHMTAPAEGGHSGEMMNALAAQGSTTMLGTLIFKTYALPFEVASILLLAAMVGAIVIAKKRFVESEELLGTVRLDIDRESAPPEDVIASLRVKRQGGSTSDTSLAPHLEIGGMQPNSPVAALSAPDKTTEEK